MPYDVFISYRRSDASDRANLIRSYLTENFRESRIFLDTHAVHEGAFPSYISEALEHATYFVVIISNDSFHDTREGVDYYYEEIRAALRRNMVIIPVIFDGLSFDTLKMPKEFKPLTQQNCITVYPDYPEGLKQKLLDFTSKRRNRHVSDWITLPLAIITTYLAVTLISGVGMYVSDRFFTSYDDAVQIAAQYVEVRNGEYLYHISPTSTVYYSPKTHEIETIPAHNGVVISEDSPYKMGFWTVAVGLAYNIVKSKYKPHNGKQVVAYVGVAVALAAGVGMGCTLERCIFPIYRTHEIEVNIRNPEFWHDVIIEYHSHYNSQTYAL